MPSTPTDSCHHNSDHSHYLDIHCYNKILPSKCGASPGPAASAWLHLSSPLKAARVEYQSELANSHWRQNIFKV